MWEWVLGRGDAVAVWGRGLWLGIDLAWGLWLWRQCRWRRGDQLPMDFDGVLNGFFINFLWVSLHGGGGCVVAVVVSLVVVAKGRCGFHLCGFLL